MADKPQSIAVILLNLGGPERLQDVEPFLYNLFSDRQIIRLGPAFLQKPIAWMIAKRRAQKSRKAYALIGGGSPLKSLTLQQGAALEKELGHVGRFKVTMAMRYWQPFARETLQILADQNISRIIALTLYPHYSKATTGSSLEDLHHAAASFNGFFDITEIAAWPDQPDYIQCLADSIVTGMKQYGSDNAQLVYSAHSLPVQFIEEGDPYLDDMNKTIEAVEKIIGIKGHLCFQSRSGPVEWLSPSTPDMLEQLAGQGCSKVLMVPISFVSDHVETLYEIDIQYRELAETLGMTLKRTESLNIKPRFIAGLKNLVQTAARQKNWLS
ncbi:MAG: ferrochelatase [Proteobacteria bacterium]|nr:ferrochelatase [Pseudomonadota bacterium]MBU4296829.1 ferrochelatase [Pseudomonadota bacterium]MCG2748990.1 ferrochelatase [Desulfobulbaceae bacterium]